MDVSEQLQKGAAAKEYIEASAKACVQLQKGAAGLAGFGWNDPNFNWTQWKWLFVTNCATLILGVYLGNACATTTCAASSNASSTMSSRETPTPPSYRVA